MDLSPRAVIAGRYRVEAKVGAGGMGEVWVGELIGTGARVAIKTLLPAAALNHEVVARFKREAYLLGRIQSAHIARVVDFVPDEAYGMVLIMEFIARAIRSPACSRSAPSRSRRGTTSPSASPAR